MRRAVVALIALFLASVLLVACGGYKAPGGPTTSLLTNRAFVSNLSASVLNIINATTDKLSTFRIAANGPTIMSMSPDKKTTLVFNTGNNQIEVVSNHDEASAGSLQLAGASESFFYLPDNNTVYIAVRNAAQVVKWDTHAGTAAAITVLNVRRIVRSNNGHFVLAFPDDSSNTVYFIDTTATTPTATAVAGFDRPVWAVFSSDDSVAYVMNCGPECGGAAASVQVLNTPALTLGTNIPVPGGATYGLLNSSTLYVAGTPSPAPACSNVNSPSCGRLSVINNISSASSVSASYEINDGYHDHMLMGANSKLFIGAEFTCTAVRPSGNGCLSIFNTSANTVAIPVVCGPSCNGLADVTGMSNITGRTVVYVVEGGEVHVYDTTTSALLSGVSLDVSGRSWDVVNPD